LAQNSQSFVPKHATFKDLEKTVLDNGTLYYIEPNHFNNNSYPDFKYYYYVGCYDYEGNLYPSCDPDQDVPDQHTLVYSNSTYRLWDYDPNSFVELFKKTYNEQVGKDPVIVDFSSNYSLEGVVNKTIEDNKHGQKTSMFSIFRFVNGDDESYYYAPTMIFNDKLNGGKVSGTLSYELLYNTSAIKKSGDAVSMFGPLILETILKKYKPDVTFDYSFDFIYSAQLNTSLLDLYMTPVLIAVSLIILVGLFVFQVIEDIKTPQFPFMLTFGLSVPTYWIANIIIDFIIYEIVAFIIWIINLMGHVSFIYAYPGISFYIFFINGIPFILFGYIFAHIFSKPILGAVFFLILCTIAVIFIMVFSLIYTFSDSDSGGETNSTTPTKTPWPKTQANIWLCGLFPATDYYLIFKEIANQLYFNQNSGNNSLIKTSEFFKSKKFKGLTVGPILSSFIYLIILLLVQICVKFGKRAITSKIWAKHAQEFQEIKMGMKLTDDVFKMEEKVRQSDQSKYAVKIDTACKVFTRSNMKAFPAVNSVSLGIKPGSLFGFLGANGAGKTTLINMIRGQEEISSGKIYINGVDVKAGTNGSMLAVCPQFDDHLSPILTGRQNLKFLSMIAGIPAEKANATIEHFIEVLGIGDHIDKRVKDMSGGNRRKCSVAAAFLSEADIILLDEPTASLDPIARKNVHDLINEYRGNKTFMLTTHLLSEAESLCDKISIMIKGCVFAIGKPEYLSAKFGTSFNIDITEKTDPVSETEIDNFFRTKFSTAELTLKKPGSRIYSIPSSDIQMFEIFRILQEEEDRPNSPLLYFTCSSSTLEKVFLRIVQISEQDEEEEKENEPIVQYEKSELSTNSEQSDGIRI